MNYVYDLLLNFNRNLYDFYDWNISDTVCHIRKIVLFRVKNYILHDLINSDVCISVDFLNKISNRTEVFTNQNVKMINYACLFTDGHSVIAIKFDKCGNSIEKSKLLLDEELEILDSINDFTEYNLEYKILKKYCFEIDSFKTRKEQEIEKYIYKKLKSIDCNDVDKMKYLYYECFNKREENVDKIMISINKELKKNWDSFYLKVYNFFKLISVREK